MLLLVCWWKGIQLEWTIWNALFLNPWEKEDALCACFRSALSCDGTCLAPCCECSHWAVITHLAAVWNIHGQVSPSLWVSHMDSLLSPPLSPRASRSLYSTFCFIPLPPQLPAAPCKECAAFKLKCRGPTLHSFIAICFYFVFSIHFSFNYYQSQPEVDICDNLINAFFCMKRWYHYYFSGIIYKYL